MSLIEINKKDDGQLKEFLNTAKFEKLITVTDERYYV